MEAEKLSLRKAAEQIGVSHSTLSRVLGGESFDVPTLEGISEWLGVDPGVLLGAKPGSRQELSIRIEQMLKANPDLSAVFEEALKRLDAGEVSSQAISELIAYAGYRLGLTPPSK
jgi:transcriptional regulator with XRE-family HTH domain